MNAIFFDIETAPLPDWQDRLDKFNPDDVKMGNIKDEAKREEKIEAARAAHIKDAQDRCLLDATLGRVLAAGIARNNDPVDIISGDEADIIQVVWNAFAMDDNRPPYVCGHNIKGFDLPFLCRRSLALDLRIPGGIMEGRYFSNRIFDTMEAWGFGEWRAFISLDRFARHLGLPGKTGSGKDFHINFLAGGELRKAAEIYLENDVKLVRSIVRRVAPWI